MEEFNSKVFNKGPTLILIKTSKGEICGGYSPVSWRDCNSKSNLKCGD
jgi:hypothetical protein